MTDVAQIIADISGSLDGYPHEGIFVRATDLRALLGEVRKLEGHIAKQQMDIVELGIMAGRTVQAEDELLRSLEPVAREEKIRADTAEAELARLEKHVELLQSKIDAEKSCACSYDTPDDVCAAHSPKLKAAGASLREAVEVIRKARKSYHEANPLRLADCHSADCGCFRCVMDEIDAYLAKQEPQP